MEQVNSPHTIGTPVWMIKSFAAVATADVFLAVVRHWKNYEWDDKALAVVLLVCLVAIPAAATWVRKERRRVEWANLMPTYMLLMLATVLFGMRR